METPFWKQKSLREMTSEEWESLCDGCGRCCLLKLEDEDVEDGPFYFTNVVCRLFDSDACRCRDYANRSRIVHDCVNLRRCDPAEYRYLPQTCAYRRLSEGLDLEPWHPLITGDPETVHSAGISVRGRTLNEIHVREEDLEDHIVEWFD